MSKNAVLKSLVILLFLIAGCQHEGAEQPGSGGRSFVGGNSGLSMYFIENSPPREIFDGGQFPFQVLVLYENVGESDIKAGKLRFTLTGIFPDDFGVTAEDLKAFTKVDVRGVQKDPDGNKIRGGVHQKKFPNNTNEFNFTRVITGSQEFPLRLEACYEYSTLAVSSICIREDIARPESGVCRISGTRDVSNSGAPVRVTSVKEGVGGINSVLINFRVEKSGNGEIYLPPEGKDGPDCPSEYNKRNRVHVNVSTGDPDNAADTLNSKLYCIGLILDDNSRRSGKLILTGGAGTFSCVQEFSTDTRTKTQFDAVKGIQVDLKYQVKESITTKILVKNQLKLTINPGGSTGGGPGGDDEKILNPATQKPDLSIQTIENLPSNPTAGEQHTITVDISNIGQIRSPKTRATLKIIQSREEGGGKIWDLRTYIIKPIAAGETLKARMPFDLPENMAPGQYYFHVMVNPQSTFEEPDQDNNYGTTQTLYVNQG